MAKTVTVSSGKGGVAATTTIINGGDWLGRNGWRTLILDIDRQADATKLLEIATGNQAASYLERTIEIDQAVISTNRMYLDIVPANDEVDGTAQTLAFQIRQKESPEAKQAILKVMAQRIAEAGDMYQVLLIDPPKSGAMQQAAVVACDTLIVPFMMDYASMSNAVSFMALAHNLLHSCANIIALPIGLNAMISADQQKQLDFLNEGIAGEVGRPVRVSSGIPYRVSIKKNGFRGKTAFEASAKGSVTQAYDQFFFSIFGK